MTPPLAGTTKLTVQVMDAPSANGFGVGLGKQLTVAPAGTPATAQVGAAAGLGPLLVQVTVPDTLAPAAAVAGNPVTVACISACGVTTRGLASTLFAGVGSSVELPAVVVMLRVPDAGAVNVLVQVMLPPNGSGSGIGLGLHDCVAPAGKPVSTHVGTAAPEGPALVQVPLTVTGWPATALAGTVVTACMSAVGMGLTVTCLVAVSQAAGVAAGFEQIWYCTL